MGSRLYQAFVAVGIILTTALTIWTIVEAAIDFRVRWAGYLVLFCWLASVWSGLRLLRRKTERAFVVLLVSTASALAGLPIMLIAFSRD